ncbi:MAG TPA: protein-L-isoaspartate(D-aspartate) O-methyltransferase [Anaeromyxobacteraceae bacterium]
MSERLASRLREQGIRSESVLAAVAKVPRELFVPEGLRLAAEDDRPLPIGEGQTISQPYVVAYMTELLGLRGDERVLEVGTGSGYQAAILAHLAADVYSVEILPGLAAVAGERLRALGLGNVHVRVGDGSLGWPEEAPFDRILVTAAAPSVPAALLEQLAPDGRLVLPVGPAHGDQVLELVRKGGSGDADVRIVADVRFVPLRGEAGHAGC